MIPVPVPGSYVLITPCIGEHCSDGSRVPVTYGLPFAIRHPLAEVESGKRCAFELGLLDLTGLETGCAHAGAAGVGAILDAHSLNVGEPAPTGAFVGEADLLPVPRLFSTDFATVRHEKDDPPEVGAAG
jgi:hypothetical protein